MRFKKSPLRRLRERSQPGLTQEQVVERVNKTEAICSLGHYRNVERGSSFCSRGLMSAIADVLDVHMETAWRAFRRGYAEYHNGGQP